MSSLQLHTQSLGACLRSDDAVDNEGRYRWNAVNFLTNIHKVFVESSIGLIFCLNSCNYFMIVFSKSISWYVSYVNIEL